ncbi:Ig-like domain-containing protein [Butyrivibrio sp. YAB3001]|uniref:Ig-like domain-containing protein n=1 Tax=Butyrivibrio sp. YAB3001 TaxID=1520812 RepID=UPI0008F63B5C|nr:Ig-like domain-containing protein [Butyrivibrio sp. YAB3001]SFC37790.1 Fibronectin type III domain-containing protein [Butyrivibrio sp. YAB3001]
MKKVLQRVGGVLLAIALLMCILPAQTVEASTFKIPNDAKPFNGHYYKLYYSQSGVTWAKAQQLCDALGGHLVTITSSKEETFIENIVDKSSYEEYAIGAYSKGAGWKWITNEKATYTPCGGWPSAGTDLVCAKRMNSGALDSWWTTTFYYYMCEWDTSTEDILPDQVTLSSVKKASYKSINVSWKKVSGAKGYAVYMKQDKGDYKKVADITDPSITTFNMNNLTGGSTYYFRVRAYKMIYGEKSFGELSYAKSVKLGLVKAASIKLNVKSKAINKGKSFTLKATEASADANEPIIWKSSNPNVATVSASGKVKAVAPGTAKITATTSKTKLTATCKVTVK